MKDIVPETLEEALKVIEKQKQELQKKESEIQKKESELKKRFRTPETTGRNNQSPCRN